MKNMNDFYKTIWKDRQIPQSTNIEEKSKPLTDLEDIVNIYFKFNDFMEPLSEIMMLHHGMIIICVFAMK